MRNSRGSSSSPPRPRKLSDGKPSLSNSTAKPLPATPQKASDTQTALETKGPVKSTVKAQQGEEPLEPKPRATLQRQNQITSSPRRVLQREKAIREPGGEPDDQSANNIISEPKQKLTKRKSGQFVIEKRKGGVLLSPLAQTSSTKLSRFEPFELDLGKFKLLDKGWRLKVDHSKMVVAATRYGREFVLKISPGSGLQVQGNVVAGSWIAKMQLPCIDAPGMWLMKPRDMVFCLEALRERSADDALNIEKEIFAAKKDNIPGVFTAGMISTLVAPSIDTCLEGYKLGSHTFDPVSDTDAIVELHELTQFFAQTFPGNKKPFIEHIEKGLYDEAARSVAAKAEPHLGPIKLVQFQESKLRFFFLCEQLGSPAATAALKPARKQAASARELKAWLHTQEGKYAFTMMTCVDLLFGMEDRVLARWHPGNVSFAKGTLLCIDNAKVGPSLVVGESADENLFEYVNWRPHLASRCLVEYVKAKILATGLWGERPALTLTDVANCLDFVLARAQQTALDRDDESAEIVLLRIKVLRGLLVNQDRLTADLIGCENLIQNVLSLELPEKSASTKSIVKKTLRLGLSLAPKIAKAHEAKSAVRKATEIVELSENVKTAKRLLKETDTTDQAHAKAELEVIVAEFVLALHAAKEAAEKIGYQLSPQEIDALQKCFEAWSEVDATGHTTALIKDAWSDWIARSSKS